MKNHHHYNEDLLEKLCIELRHVGCFDKELPENIKAITHITKVQQIAKELNIKFINPEPRLKLLTKETNWLMYDLYVDCLEYPKVIPYVKLLDGRTRIDIVNQEQQERKKEQEKAFKPIAKQLSEIIKKYTLGNEQQKLLDLLYNSNGRHIAVALTEIQSQFTKKEKNFVEDFTSRVF